MTWAFVRDAQAGDQVHGAGGGPASAAWPGPAPSWGRYLVLGLACSVPFCNPPSPPPLHRTHSLSLCRLVHHAQCQAAKFWLFSTFYVLRGLTEINLLNCISISLCVDTLLCFSFIFFVCKLWMYLKQWLCCSYKATVYKCDPPTFFSCCASLCVVISLAGTDRVWGSWADCRHCLDVLLPFHFLFLLWTQSCHGALLLLYPPSLFLSPRFIWSQKVCTGTPVSGLSCTYTWSIDFCAIVWLIVLAIRLFCLCGVRCMRPILLPLRGLCNCA